MADAPVAVWMNGSPVSNYRTDQDGFCKWEQSPGKIELRIHYGPGADFVQSTTVAEGKPNFRRTINGSDCKPVVDWYSQKMSAAGFRISGLSYEFGTGTGCYVTAEDASHAHTLKVHAVQNPISILYTAVERNTKGGPPEAVGGGTVPQIPDWAPIYPGTTPSQMGVNQSSDGIVTRFQLSTGDTCAAVIDWYRQRLQAAGFRTFDRVEDQSRRSGCDARVSAEGPQGRSMKVRAVTYSFNVNIDVETTQR